MCPYGKSAVMSLPIMTSHHASVTHMIFGQAETQQHISHYNVTPGRNPFLMIFWPLIFLNQLKDDNWNIYNKKSKSKSTCPAVSRVATGKNCCAAIILVQNPALQYIHGLWRLWTLDEKINQRLCLNSGYACLEECDLRSLKSEACPSSLNMEAYSKCLLVFIWFWVCIASRFCILPQCFEYCCYCF